MSTKATALPELEYHPLIETNGKNVAPVSSFTGIASAFKEAGFVEVARRSERRPIMRCYL